MSAKEATTTMAYASRYAAATHLAKADQRQIEEPLDYGIVISFCNDYEDFPCNRIIRMQGAGGDFRTFDGCWSVLWQDGWDISGGFTRQLPRREILCGL